MSDILKYLTRVLVFVVVMMLGQSISNTFLSGWASLLVAQVLSAVIFGEDR